MLIQTRDGPNNFLFNIITKEAPKWEEEEVLLAPYKDPRQLPIFMKSLY